MQDPVQKFRQSSIVLIKLRNNFCRNFVHVSYLPMSTKVFLGFSIFCLEHELFAKIKKSSGFYTFTETRFISNSRSKQDKKYPEHPFAGHILCFIHAIVTYMRVPFFKIISDFVHFCPNFQILFPFFVIFVINSTHALSRIDPAFVDIAKTETCATFQQKIVNSLIVGDCQNFQFSDK